MRKITAISLVLITVISASLLLGVIPAMAGISDNVIENWHFNETSGVRYPSINSGINFNDFGTVSYTTSGKLNNAVSIAGAGYLSTQDIDFNLANCTNDGMSFTLWFYTTSNDRQAIIHKGDNANSALEFDLSYSIIDSNKITWWVDNTTGGDQRFTYSDTLAINTWHFIAGGIDCINNQLWLQVNDGDREYLSHTSEYESTHAIIAGAYLNAGEYLFNLNGRLDELSFHKGTLTDNEVTTLFNSGDGCAYNFAACDSTPTPTATPAPYINLILDGDFEDYPNVYWSAAAAYPAGASIKFGRYNPQYSTSAIINSWNLHNPPAYCGNGLQYIGPVFVNGSLSVGHPIKQTFINAGSTIYYRLYHRTSTNNTIAPRFNLYVIDSTGAITYLENNRQTANTWGYIYDDISLPAGTYTLVLENNNFSYGSNPYTVNDRNIIFYDDLVISNTPLSNPAACSSYNIGAQTPTPTPLPTFTPGPTYAPLTLVNCSFENSLTGWSANSQSQLIYAGGPIGPIHVLSMGSGAGVSQGFNINYPGLLYVSGWVKGDSRVDIRNISTGAIYTIHNQPLGVWTLIKNAVYIPAGAYSLDLRPGGYYDGFSLSVNGYSYCNYQGHQQQTPITPTSGATQYANPTATPTPQYSPTITRTQGLSNTRTPAPSWTPTPTGSITPLAPPQQPEPIACEDGCIRPIFDLGWSDLKLGLIIGYMGWWLEYIICKLLAFLAFGPAVTEPLLTWWSCISLYEPLGSLLDLYTLLQELLYITNNTYYPTGGICYNMFGISTSLMDVLYWLNNSMGSLWSSANPLVLGGDNISSWSCNFGTAGAIIPQVFRPYYCFVMAAICSTRLWAILQLLMDAGAIYLFVRYIYKTFIMPAS